MNFFNSMPTSKLSSEVKKYVDKDGSLKDHYTFLKNYLKIKNKEILKQSIEEFERSRDFIRIFPSKNSNLYNKYFENKRSANVFIYKILFTDDILPLDTQDYSEPISSTIDKESEKGEYKNSPNQTPVKIPMEVITKIKPMKKIPSSNDMINQT